MMGNLTKRILITFCIFLLLDYSVDAQQDGSRYDFLNLKKIQSYEGLSNNSVLCIFKDSEGYIWAGTRDGLNRYDGYNFKVFHKDQEDSTSIGSNKINCIFEDSRKRLWIGTNDGGLSLFNKLTEDFTNFTYDPNDSTSISQNGVTGITEDSSGRLWIGTYYGLNVFDPENKTFRRLLITPNDLNDCRFYSVMTDNRGKIWAGTEIGIKVIDPITYTTKCYYNNPSDPSSISNLAVHDILQDSKNNIWIASMGGGLSRYNENNDAFIHYRKDAPTNFLRKLMEDEHGNIWLASSDNGLIVFNTKTLSFKKILSKNDPGLGSASMQYIYRDDEGIVWTGTHNEGIKVFSQNSKNFRHYRYFTSAPEFMDKNSTISFAEDKHKNIWFGTGGAGLYKFDPSKNTFTQFRHQPENPNSISGNIVKSLMIDDRGLIYIGTFSNGLNIYNPKTNTFKKFKHDPNDPHSIGHNNIWALIQDSEKRIWVGTLGAGINEYIPGENKFIRHEHNELDSTSISNNLISKIFEDSNNTIWIATYGGGLNKMIKKKDSISFINYQHDPLDHKSLSSDNTVEIFEDSRQRLWIGTLSGGLNYFNEKNESFIQISGDIDTYNSILGILEDNSNNLWISSFRGLYKFNPETNVVKHFDIYDGLQGNEFRSNSMLKSSDGMFYFGGINGFNVFNPDSIKDNRYIPKISFTDFYLFHKNITEEDDPESFLKGNINHLEKITLKANQNVISFGYTALEYHYPKNNQYAYILEGFDEDWNDVGIQRMATYTNIPPGDYIFKVKCSNNDGVWGENFAQIKITIQSHWYSAPWFTWMIAFISILIVVFIIQFRTRLLINQKKNLEHQVKNRTRQLLFQKSEIEVKNQELHDQNKMILQQNEELISKNEEISAQREQILEKTMLLQEAHEKISITNNELKQVNSNLEKLVEVRTTELQEAMKKLVKTDEELNLFIYRSSHDLRGPITTLMGLANLANTENKQPELSHYFEKINKSCLNMLKVLKKLNDTNIVFNTNKEYALINWEEIFNDISSDLKYLDNYKKAEITINNHIEKSIYSEPLLLQTIIHNLFENALIFQSPNKPYVDISLTLSDKDIIIVVKDNGHGMDPEVIKNIFKMFYRGSQASIGNGLGLYLTKKAIELLNGDIKVDSKLNMYSIFEVRIPVHFLPPKSKKKTAQTETKKI